MKQHVDIDWSRWVIGVDVDRWSDDNPYSNETYTDILIFIGPIAINLKF